jgi:hypothetical protein
VLDVRVLYVREENRRDVSLHGYCQVCLEKIRSTDSSKSAHDLNAEGVDLFVDIDLYGKRRCWHESLVISAQKKKKSIPSENNGAMGRPKSCPRNSILSMAKKKKWCAQRVSHN